MPRIPPHLQPTGAAGAPQPGMVSQPAATPSLAAAPDPPPTTAADRSALSAAGGTSVLAERAGSEMRAELQAKLGKPIAQAVLRALERLTGPSRREADAGVAALCASPIAQRLAVALLNGRAPAKVQQRDVDLFTQASLPPAGVSEALAAFGRKNEINRVLAGIHGTLGKLLSDALTAHPDPRAVESALSWLDTELRGASGSMGVSAVLVAAGSLPPRWLETPSFLPGSDPIALLAARRAIPQSSPADPAGVADYTQRVAASGLVGSERWSRTVDLANRRGMIAETLRLMQIAADPSQGGLRAEPGVLVVDQPAGLDACRTSREAEAWCAKNNHGREGLFRWTTPAGPQFGFLLTEVDVVLLAARPNGKLACIRMENVKAGNGSAADARKQNRVAIDALARPSVRLLCRPKNAGRNTYEDIRPRLDAASGAPEAATVGPSGDPRYDVALPLSAGDITEVARRLGNGSALAT